MLAEQISDSVDLGGVPEDASRRWHGAHQGPGGAAVHGPRRSNTENNAGLPEDLT
jgi:hypothetical protein